MHQPQWSRISRRKPERRKNQLKSWLQVEALEDRAMPSTSQWVAVFNNLAPADTLEQQTTSAKTLLNTFGVTEDEVRVLAALDLSGSYLVETADSVTQSELNAQLGAVAGYVYTVSFEEADPSTLRKIQPQRARSEALFGPFDYDTFLSREKNGEFPDHSGTPEPDPFNVLTNNNTGATGTGLFTQSETAIIAWDNNVVIGFNDSGSNSGGTNKFTGWSYSNDGGATFTDGGVLPNHAIGDAGDPVLARNNTTGRIYYSTLGFTSPSTIQMWRSDDNGVSWMAPVNATPGGSSEDKQWHTVDNFPGAGNGNVYVLSRRFGAGPGIYFFRSTDHGATFGPNGGTLITTGAQGAYVAVAPDHSIYAFWYAGATIQMRKSTDFGLTFAAPVTVASGLVGGTNGDLALTGLRQGTGSFAGFRSNEFPHAAVNPANGHIYVTFANNPAGTDKADIFMVQSTNGGATWGPAIRVNDDATTTDQWQPTIAVTPDGSRLGIFYYSRQEDTANNNLFKYWGRVGVISGSSVSFLDSFPISDVASLPEFGRDSIVNSVYMGDYDMAAATPGAFHVVWSDNRTDLPGGPPRKNPDVFYKKIALGLAVAATTPPVGSIVSTAPTSFTVVFSDPIDATSLEASDFSVNGVPADTVAYNAATKTATFTFGTSPVTTQGVQSMAIGAGTIVKEGSTEGILGFSGTFRFDQTALQVTSTAPAFPNGVFTLPGPFTYDVTFNEAINPASVQLSDLSLSGVAGAFVSAFEVQPDNQTIRFTLGGLFTLEGALTASIAGGAVTDAFGNPGTAFSATYQVDIGVVPYPTPLAAESPLGSLIYDPTIAGTINFGGDTDGFALALDPGQKLSVLVRPSGAGLRPTVEVRDASNALIASHTAAAPGQNALIQTAAISGGTYTITVLGAGDTTGGYSVQAVLNAALEEEGLIVGADNDTIGLAQDPGDSFVSLTTGAGHYNRGGVSGVTDDAGYFAAAVPFAFEDISATGTVIAGLANQDDASVSIPIGFTFPFYGTNNTTVFVSSNGLLTFGTANSSFTNADLTATPSQAAIAPFWDDLHTGGGAAASGVRFQVLGSGATQHLTIQWNQVRFFSGGTSGDTLTFQAQLYVDGRVQFNYQDLVSGGSGSNNGASASVGVKAAGTQGPNRLLLAFNNGPNAFVGTNQSTLINPPNPTPDMYTVELTAGERATIAIASQVAATLNVALLDGGGGVLAMGVGGSTSLANVIAGFNPPTSGTYYVRVTGGTNIPYNLVVTNDAGFDTEANDSFATAQSIAGTHGALGAISPTGFYLPTAASFAFEDISGTGTVIAGLTSQDDAAVSIPIGFTFPFYGTNNTTIFVSSNGLLTFGTGNSGFTNADLTATPSQAAIAPFWDDLHTGGGAPGSNVFSQVTGTGLDQHLTIQWNQVRFFTGGTTGDTLTFQAQLYVDGRVQFNYQDLASGGAAGNNGASASVGIKAAGTQGPNRLLLAFNNGPNAFVNTGRSTLITQPPGDDWYKINVADGDVISLATLTPGAGAGEPVNGLEPGLELYDPLGALVLSGSTLADGINQGIDAYAALESGEYRVRITGRDSSVGAYALGANFSPAISGLTLDNTSINENGTVTLTVAFTDPDLLDAHQVEINWGPGEGSTVVDLAPGVYSYTTSWQYLDDNPTATGADNYSIGVTVSDNHEGSIGGSSTATVNNVAPVVAAITGPSPGPAVRGQTLSFSSSFTDVGTLDSHEVSWDFGDGTIIPFHSTADASALTPTHVYATEGTYTVTLTIRDDDTGATPVTKSVPVTVYGLQDDPFIPGATDLVVGGGNGDDVIRFHPVGTSGDVSLVLNGVTLGTFHPTGRLIAYGQGGNDDIQVASSLSLMAWLYGDAGNDRLKGGSGPSLLMGGIGNDNVNGGNGRGFLIGGLGADRVIGGSGEDLLIGGTTTHDKDDAALFGIIAEWASSRDYATRVANIRGEGSGTRLNAFYFLTASGSSPTVLDDGAVDVMTGASGLDWFFLAPTDTITDDRDGEEIG